VNKQEFSASSWRSNQGYFRFAALTEGYITFLTEYYYDFIQFSLKRNAYMCMGTDGILNSYGGE
jgi:hypothetical protein